MILTKGKAMTIDEFIDKKKDLEMRKIEALRELWKNKLMPASVEIFGDLDEEPLTYEEFEDLTEEYTNAYGSFHFNSETNQWEETPY